MQKKYYKYASIIAIFLLSGCVPDVDNTAKAVNDNAIVYAGESISIDVLANDEETSGERNPPKKIESVTQPEHGTIVIESNATITYTADSDFSGTDTFSYVLAIRSMTDEANVTILVNDPVGMVTVGDLMWEDTDHARNTSLTWSEAESYCDTLELGDFDDWRMPHGDESNLSLSEPVGIRKLPLKTDGEEWNPEEDDRDEIDNTSRTIIEPFVKVAQADHNATWTNAKIGDGSHLVFFFAYQKENADGMGDEENVTVRCVRDIE
jgi:hypothetical protein